MNLSNTCWKNINIATIRYEWDTVYINIFTTFFCRDRMCGISFSTLNTEKTLIQGSLFIENSGIVFM